MSAPSLVQSEDLVVALDYGQFLLHTAGVEDFDLPLRLVERAVMDGGIAQDGGSLVVCSPHQNNFEMALRVETWASRPVDDLVDWPEAFEAHLAVGSFGLLYESPTVNVQWLSVPPGGYHAEIAGRDFVARGWPGSTTPGDRWRIRLWPEQARCPARRISAWTPAQS